MDRTARMMSRQQARRAPGSGARGANDQAMYNESVDANQARYRDDYGFAMTEEGYQNLLAHQKEFGSSAEEARRALAKAQGQVDSAGNVASMDEMWDKYKQSWSAIHVVNGSNIEGTYYLPKEAIDKLNSGSFNQGDGSYVGKWNKDGSYNVDVVLQGGDDAYGKELHEAIGKAEGEIKTQYWKSNESKVKEAQKRNEAAKKKAQDQIDTEKGNVDAAVYMNDTELAHYKEQYAKKRKSRKNMFALGGK